MGFVKKNLAFASKGANKLFIVLYVEGIVKTLGISHWGLNTNEKTVV